jgi:hypothetical protein
MTEASLARTEGQGRDAHTELLEAARFAAAWFREREKHAPPESGFGGESRVEKRLRLAIVRATREEM